MSAKSLTGSESVGLFVDLRLLVVERLLVLMKASARDLQHVIFRASASVRDLYPTVLCPDAKRLQCVLREC